MEKEENKTSLTPEEETLFLVRKLWRAEKWRRFWTIFRYVVYIGVLLGAFYFVTPYVEKLTSMDLQKILEQLK